MAPLIGRRVGTDLIRERWGESRGKLAGRILALVSGHARLERIAQPMLTAREAL